MTGDVNFGRNVTLRGTVIIVANEGQRIDIPDGCVLENRLLSGNLNMIVRVSSLLSTLIFLNMATSHTGPIIASCATSVVSTEELTGYRKKQSAQSKLRNLDFFQENTYSITHAFLVFLSVSCR